MTAPPPDEGHRIERRLHSPAGYTQWAGMTARLKLTREQILGFRRRVGALDERLPAGAPSLRQAAWAGLQDSMPRAALLSIHARVEETGPDTWEDPSLVQLWGPGYSAYVVAAEDRAVFTLGRLRDDERARRRAGEMAARLHAVLDGARMTDTEVGEALGINPSSIRYAAPTGTVMIRWEGARAPLVWTVPAPEVDLQAVRLELARRHLHIFGPTSAGSFASWAGMAAGAAGRAYEASQDELTPVKTPIGDASLLTSDEEAARSDPHPGAPARLLPSGDTFFLLHGDDRALLIPDSARQDELWTSRVWPGAVLVDGEIVGTWRRKMHRVTIRAWEPVTVGQQEAVEAEAATLPLPGVDLPVEVSWDS